MTTRKPPLAVRTIKGIWLPLRVAKEKGPTLPSTNTCPAGFHLNKHDPNKWSFLLASPPSQPSRFPSNHHKAQTRVNRVLSVCMKMGLDVADFHKQSGLQGPLPIASLPTHETLASHHKFPKTNRLKQTRASANGQPKGATKTAALPLQSPNLQCGALQQRPN